MLKGLNRFFLVAMVAAVIAAPASAQYTEEISPACGGYSAIGGTSGASLLTGITNSDDAAQNVALPFTFMFYGDTPFNSVYVNSNGGLVFAGSTSSQCCTAYPVQTGAFPAYPVIQVVKEDLDAGDYGDIWYKDTGSSVIISWEGVAFWANTGQANGQVELWPSGEFELRWSNTQGDAFDDVSCGGEDETHAPAWAAPATGGDFDTAGRIDFGTDPPLSGCRLFSLDTGGGGGGDCDLTPVLAALDILEAKSDRIEATVNALDASFAALAAGIDEIQSNQCEMVRLLTTPQGRRVSECGGETYSWNDNVDSGD